jgi:hypothetical protein
MKQILKLVFLLVIGQTAFAQAPSNYTNINGRYRWIAGMFDSTFHIPKGSTPSLRTGGSTNAGALFYKTGDSSLYIYSGTQWLKIAGAAGFVPYSGATQNVNLGIYDILAKSATITDTGGTAANILQRTSINTDVALNVKAVGNRGYAMLIDQADSVAAGTQYQTIFRKSMMPGTGNPANGGGVSWYTQIGNDNDVYRALSVYRARVIDSTGFANSNIQQTSTEFWTRKAGVWDTTLVLNGGNVGINTGQNGIDSALTVANGTWLKRGVRMSALPTGVGTKALRIDANGNVSATDTTAVTGYVPYTGATQDLDMGTFSVNAKSFHIKGTAGQGHLGLKHQTATPTVSANESGVYADVNGDLGLKNDNLYTSIFKTSLNTADRTYTFQDKSYTVGDSADIAARVKYTDTASMLSPYLRSNVAAATYVPQTRTITINGTSQDLSANRTYNVGTVTSVGATAGTGISVSGSPITSSGSLTITNTAPDQTVVLNNGTGISVTGTYPNFTITNTSPSSGGTVTSVATNTGTGITGGTFTTSGTIAADTLLLSTRAWRQKGVDSVAALISSNISGTTNYIPKFTSSSAIGNSVIYDNGGSIGINITDASFPLEVSSNAGGSSIKIRGRATANSGTLRFYSNDNTTQIAKFEASDNAVEMGAITNVPLVFVQNASEQMRLTSTGLGIGTSSNTEAAKLNVQGGYIFLKETGGADVYFRSNFTGNAAAIQVASNNPLAFATNNIQRMLLDASGNLGIGTSSPDQIGYGAGTIIGILSPAADATNLQLGVVGSSGATSGNLADINFFGKNATASVVNRALFRAGIDGATNSNFFSFWTMKAGSLTEKMRLDASGNLGLGVTPSAWSSSYKAIQFGTTGSIFGESGDAANYYTTNTFIDAGGFKYITSDFALGYFQENGVHSWRTAASGTAGNAISFTQAMTLDASGRLGIGVTSMLNRLDVGGSIGIGVNGTNDIIWNTAGGIKLSRTNVGPEYALSQRWTGSLAYVDIASSTQWNGGVTILPNGGGNVGIGTTSPTNKLQSYGGTLTVNDEGTYSARFSNGSTKGVVIGYDNTNNKGHISSVNPAVSWTDLILNANGGNVGIGTSSPASLLHLNVSSGSIFSQITSGANQTYLGFDAGSGLTTLQSNNSIYFGTGASAAERMRITSGGEVLINTTSDAGDYKLQVNGNSYLYGNVGINGSADRTLTINGDASLKGNNYISTNKIIQWEGGAYWGLKVTGGSSDQFEIFRGDTGGIGLKITSSNNTELLGSIKTAAPSAGNAAAWKLGERVASAGVTFNDQQYIQLDIAGTTYYLATVDLPMPEAYPQATSGPSNNYKITPVQVKTTRDAEIEKLRKEIEELKQLIKNK